MDAFVVLLRTTAETPLPHCQKIIFLLVYILKLIDFQRHGVPFVILALEMPGGYFQSSDTEFYHPNWSL